MGTDRALSASTPIEATAPVGETPTMPSVPATVSAETGAVDAASAGVASPISSRPTAAVSATVTVENRVLAVAHYLRGTPLEGEAAMLVRVAADFDIDWRTLPAIAIRESSGGAAACGFNAWGLGNCEGPAFSSWEEAARASAKLFVEVGGRDDPYYALRVWQAGGNGAAAGGGLSYATEVAQMMDAMGPA